MSTYSIPKTIPNWIGGEEVLSSSQQSFPNLNPHDGTVICQITRSQPKDVQAAIASAKSAQVTWAETPAPQRGEILFEITQKMLENQNEIAKLVALETGKSFKDALGETGAAIALGRYMAGEGRRMYGYTMTSASPGKHPMVLREPVGLAGLIIAANTPIANVAWKVFPALICGNGALLKSSEDTPLTSWIFGKLAHETKLPKGILNILQGYGQEAGAPLVESKEIDLVSFTGSTAVGRYVAEVAGKRLAKVSLELGGKNPLVVCDDADLENAVKWTLASSFSNAGQRCASSSRIIIFEGVYEKFKSMLLEQTQTLKVGPTDQDDLGPVINEKQLKNMLLAVKEAEKEGARILVGGKRLEDSNHQNGFYMAPTVLEGADPKDAISQKELFGPIASLYRVKNFDEAVELANCSEYGLTSAIHTRNLHRAVEFSRRMKAGVVNVNGGTHGSEPHMLFGGVKQSGNGTREPGREALDVYSNYKTVSYIVDAKNV